MRPRSRSYGDSSIRTRSPGNTRIRYRFIRPAMYPSVSCPLSSLIRNIRFRIASRTSPSNSTFSSFSAIRSSRCCGAVAARGGHGSTQVLRRDRGDVCRLGALGPLTRLELDACTLGEALEARAGDVAVVHEQILRPVVGGDEAVALAVVEPLHSSACHGKTPPLTTHERVRKALKREPDSL